VAAEEAARGARTAEGIRDFNVRLTEMATSCGFRLCQRDVSSIPTFPADSEMQVCGRGSGPTLAPERTLLFAARRFRRGLGQMLVESEKREIWGRRPRDERDAAQQLLLLMLLLERSMIRRLLLLMRLTYCSHLLAARLPLRPRRPARQLERGT
jgi:hypothetical protein